MKIVIQGELIDLNKYINAERTHRLKAARIKKQQTDKCAIAFMPIRTKKIKNPFILNITWVCKNKRIDPDNRAYGVKYILDGMQQVKLIENDGFNQVKEIHHYFEVDKDNPRIEVEIKEEKQWEI